MDFNQIQIQATSALASQLNLNVQSNSVSPQMTQLSLTQILLGAVVGSDKNGNVIVRLAGNDLILSSPIALAKGAQLALKIENISGSMIATLLSIDGKLPASQPQKANFLAQPNPQEQENELPQNQNQQNSNQANNNPTLRIISVLPQGAGKPVEELSFPPNNNIITDTVELSSPPTSPLSAIVIAPTPDALQTIRAKLGLKDDSVATNSELEESLPEEIKPGTNLQVRITGSEPPQSAASANQNPVATDNRTLTKPDQPASEKTTTEKSSADNLQSRAQNFVPQIKVSSNGNITLKGLVLHSEPNGEVLLQTAIGKVLVNAGQKFSAVEKGSLLSLDVSDISTSVDDSVADDNSPLTTLSKQWPALQSLDDRMGSDILNKLAGVDPFFASRLDGFANAVRSGDIKSWLGNNYYDDLLATDDGKDIINKLKADLDTIRENFGQPNQNGWQTMLFPIFDGQQLNQARLHVKYLPDENNKPDAKAGTRFLVEINTSYFGEIQMDGLVRSNLSKHFDLMIRTHDALDTAMTQDISTIFNDAAELTGFKGNLEFSVAREFPKNILGVSREQPLAPKMNYKGTVV